MENNTPKKEHTTPKKEHTTPKKEHTTPKKQYKHKYYKKEHHKKDSVALKWELEDTDRAIKLTETKADLMNILEEINPDELLMTSLVQQSRLLKSSIVKQKDIEEIPVLDSEQDDSIILETPKVKIDLSQTCPICDKPIREIMYALHDYDHDRLAHFDCVYKKVSTSVEDKLINDRYLAYLGSGSFGIMESNTTKKTSTLIEKIYPGAPLEELLHGDDPQNTLDEEL